MAVYGRLFGSRVRSQTTYRASFTLDVVGSVGFALVELLELYVIFHNVDVLGGLDLPAALLVFGLARLGFAVTDMVVGHLDQLGELVRTGRVEVLLVRPAPALAQIVTLDFQPRRVGGVVTSGIVLGVALVINDISWTTPRAALVVLAVLASCLIFSALWIVGGSWQLWAVDASDAVNTFTSGGGYAADFPTSIFPRGLREVFTFVIPAAFAGYLPTLVLLDLPGPPGLPQWLGWWSPVMGVTVLTAAIALWGRGLRHYTGAGG